MLFRAALGLAIAGAIAEPALTAELARTALAGPVSAQCEAHRAGCAPALEGAARTEALVAVARGYQDAGEMLAADLMRRLIVPVEAGEPAAAVRPE